MKTSSLLSKTKLTAFVLAFDESSGMHSSLSKYAHPVAGMPMILRVVKTLMGLSNQQEVPINLDINVVITKDTYPQIKEFLSSYPVSYIQQDHLKSILDDINSNLTTDSQSILFLSADSFLIQMNDLISIIKKFQKSSTDLTVATYHSELSRHKIEEVMGNKNFRSNVYLFKKTTINDLLSQPYSYQKNNLANYLLDLFLKFSQKNQAKTSYILLDEDISYPVDSQQELAVATKRVFQKKCQKLMDRGVVIIDPESTYIEDDVDIKATTLIYPNTYILGDSQIAEGCEIEPHSMIRDSRIGSHVKIRAGSCLEGTVIESHSLIGPYARLRPETHIGEHCKIGNFVETKKAILADHTKASHLSYLGDVEIGSNVNIGCGVVTCNYREDHKKYKTLIEDNVFVGSDVQFIAPVKIGEGSVIGSGSTITDDVPSSSLAIARAKQVIKKDRVVNKKLKKTKEDDVSKD